MNYQKTTTNFQLYPFEPPCSGHPKVGKANRKRHVPNIPHEEDPIHYVQDPDEFIYPRDLMEIFIEDLHSKTQILRLTSNKTTIRSLIHKISDVYSISPKELRLTLGSKELANFTSMTLEDVGVKHFDTIRLKLRLKGGGQLLERAPQFISNSSMEGLNCNSVPQERILSNHNSESHEKSSISNIKLQEEFISTNNSEFLKESQNSNCDPQLNSSRNPFEVQYESTSSPISSHDEDLTNVTIISQHSLVQNCEKLSTSENLTRGNELQKASLIYL